MKTEKQKKIYTFNEMDFSPNKLIVFSLVRF